ncbi:MAG: hypothetical protein Q7U54_12855 [Bacteroidales bacterium]|nr:hypothetical protein [Bacteroidales bacterium]
MKNLIIIIITVIPFIYGCKKENEKDPVLSDRWIREIAWNSLSDYDKSTVIVDWQQAPLAKSRFNGISAYAVSFNTSMDALLGPITVYVSVTANVAIGQDMRD